MPDLVSHCQLKPRLNRHVYETGPASEQWMIRGGKVKASKADSFKGLKAGLLTAMCYPDCGPVELRATTDFMYYLFHL
jgi:hypothetical protein